MGKNHNNSTTVKEAPKPRKRWQDTYLNFRSRRLIPIDVTWLDELGDNFLEYCYKIRTKEFKERRMFTYERWLEENGIAYNTCLGWQKKSKKLRDSVKFGMMCIGNYLEEGVVNKELSEKATLYQLHNYLDRWRNLDDYHDGREIMKRKADAQNKEPIKLIIEKV